MKLIYCCKKHYKKIMKDLESVEYSEKMGAMNYISGVRVGFYVKPYLKKVRIINLDELKFKLEPPEVGILNPEWRVVQGWGVKDLRISNHRLEMGVA